MSWISNRTTKDKKESWISKYPKQELQEAPVVQPPSPQPTPTPEKQGLFSRIKTGLGGFIGEVKKEGLGGAVVDLLTPEDKRQPREIVETNLKVMMERPLQEATIYERGLRNIGSGIVGVVQSNIDLGAFVYEAKAYKRKERIEDKDRPKLLRNLDIYKARQLTERASILKTTSTKIEKFRKEVAVKDPTILDRFVESAGTTLAFMGIGLVSGGEALLPSLIETFGEMGQVAVNTEGRPMDDRVGRVMLDGVANGIYNYFTNKFQLSSTESVGLKKMLLGFLAEGTQEGNQQWWSNITSTDAWGDFWKKLVSNKINGEFLFKDTSPFLKEMTAGIPESFIMGGIIGSIFSLADLSSQEVTTTEKPAEKPQVAPTKEPVTPPAKVPVEVPKTDTQTLPEVFKKDVSKYSSAEDFAESLPSVSSVESKVGFMDPNTIVARDAIDEDYVNKLTETIKTGIDTEPIIVIKDGDAITTLDGSNRLTAYQRAGKPVPVVNNTAEKIGDLLLVKDIFEEGIAKEVKPKKAIDTGMGELKKVYKASEEKVYEAMGTVFMEMDMAEAGQRIFLEHDATSPDPRIIGIKSTFPQWVPEHLRSKKLFDSVLGGIVTIEDLKYPAGNRTRQRELYDYILERVDSIAGVDTSEIRGGILEAHDTIAKEKSKKRKAPKESKKAVKAPKTTRKRLAGSKRPVTKKAEVTKHLSIDRKMTSDFYLKRNADNALKVDKISPARTPEELTKRLEQLHKFAQSHAILRKIGGVKKDAGGQFTHGEKLPPEGEIRLRASAIQDDTDYISVLSHETGHAIEKNLTGTTGKQTYKVFADTLTKEQVATLTKELKAVTKDLVGAEAVLAKPRYYNKRTELFARFIEKMIVAPSNLTEIAPTAVDLFEKNSIKHPILREFMEASTNAIDKGAKKPLLPSLRSMYQKHLGNRVGNIAYDAEIVHRAMQERAKIVIEKFVKKKFKNVKDEPSLLFKSAEAIKITRGGTPTFGTVDYVKAKNATEEQKLKDTGFEKVSEQLEEGKVVPVYSRTRYTAEEGQATYDSLSPEGKQLIRDFTSARDEAKDYFNRELIKDVHAIEGNIEGWVHHIFEDTPGGVTTKKGLRFKKKKAGARKKRTHAEGYVEDLQKSMTKALVDLESEKATNEFITKQFAQVTKPIKAGEKPDAGWTEVVGDVLKGVGTKQEKKLIIVKDGKTFVPKRARYQMPTEIYNRYKLVKGVTEEASRAVRIINDINRYWRINVLAHPGTATTNQISGAIQYSTKVLTDFYTEVLTGNIKFEKTKGNVSAMLKVLLPKGWSENSPDWVWGGDLSNYYGQFSKKPTIASKTIDSYGNKALKLFGWYESYWKKTIAIAENVGDLKSLEKVSKEGLRLPTREEKKLIASINSEIDLYAYDYDNVPTWLQSHQKSALGQAIKPFAKYPYKYAQHVTEMATSIFDQSIPWEVRVSKLLSLATVMAMYAEFSRRRKEKQQTPEGTEKTPARLRTLGRLFMGTDKKGKELFTRVSKYPFFNITEMGIQFLKGEWASGVAVFSDMIGSLGPVAEATLLLKDYRTKWETYDTVPVILGKRLGTFLPGFRVFNDVSRMLDPYQRKQKTFGQAFIGKLIPTTSEDLQKKLHGEKRTVKIPLEEGMKKRIGESYKRTTTDRLLKNYWQDILLSLFTGIYTTRIDPKQAEAFITREEKNKAKK